MKGELRIFLTTPLIFSHVLLIFLRFAGVVDLVYYLTYGCIDLLVTQNFLCGIHEKHIQTILDGQVVLLFSIAFADAALEKIAFDGSFEQFLWDGNHETVHIIACSLAAEITQPLHIAMLTLGKKHRDAYLAAQSFFLRKSIAGLLLHF